MISKNQIKFIRSLHRKKGREQNRLFIIEGDKMVRELLELSDNQDLKFKIHSIYALSEWIEKHAFSEKLLTEISAENLKQISCFQTPNQALALVHFPNDHLEMDCLKGNISIALCNIQDPGNVGTIIRTAAWFGIKNIIASNDTVDFKNPKLIQSSMSGIHAVNFFYRDLHEFLPEYKKFTGHKVYGSFLDGENLYTHQKEKEGLILLGNESKGIDPRYEKYITHRVFIPGAETPGVESLNVSTAAGILISWFCRNDFI